MFWRKAFSNITDEKFNKEYRYNVRHSYGLEGNRKNYSPYRFVCLAISHVMLISSCQQIILGPQPGAGDAHGCPFRTFGIDNLVASCQSLGINDTRQLREIQDAIQGKHYHVACTKVWEYTHPGYKEGLVESISHPNQYFERSIALEKEQVAEVKIEDTVKTEAAQD